MGSNSFTEYKQGDDMMKAFQQAVADARYEHGSGGYTGSIAEKSSVRLVSSIAVPLHEAEEMASRELEDYGKWDKWGDAGAIRVRLGKTTYESREVSFKLRIPQGITPEAVKAACIKALRLKKNESVRGWNFRTASVANMKTVTDNLSSKVPSSTMYEVRINSRVLAKCKTVAEARAAAVEAAATNHDQEVTVVGVVSRDSEPMAKYRSRVVKGDYVCQVMVDIESAPYEYGWLFFGNASS